MEIHRQPDNPMDRFGGMSLPSSEYYKVMDALDLDQIANSWAIDQNGGQSWMHFNLGVAPHVLMETFREGPRIMVPLVRSERWPLDLAELRYLTESCLRLIVDDRRNLTDLTIKLYLPPLIDSSGRSFEKTFMNEVFTSLVGAEGSTERNLKLELYPRGRPVVLN